MTLVCATHPSIEAIARCVNCGLHLCTSCRAQEGVRNYCSRCRAELRSTTAPLFASAVAVPSIPIRPIARPTPRSPALGAFLSLVPGLGQAYAGRVVRGALFFGGMIALRHAPWSTPLLGAFFYVFNLFDAYRLAQNRRDGFARGHAPVRTDDVIFLLVGLGAVAVTMNVLGGFLAAPNHALVPLAGFAASLLVAHESRR